jgi:deoxyhypusine synthase
MEENFRHFNARETLDAAKAWVEFTGKGNKMFLAMAGAMSTGEIGISLAKLIRAGLIHGISCTGANLEEDIFNLVAHNDYKMVPHYRNLTQEDEEKLLQDGYNRVTDTCIPESVMYNIDEKLVEYWMEADRKGQSLFPAEFVYRLIDEGVLDAHRQIPRKHSWVIAAYETGIPIYTPGWEDSTLGNSFSAEIIYGRIKRPSAVRHGTEQMAHIVRWYLKEGKHCDIGFFQIGGGIAGDFAICAVPLILQDLTWLEENIDQTEEFKYLLKRPCKLWGYFCQISDAVTSYGGYSGATPSEKITWNKLSKECPKFMIQSDASIVAPLIFQYVLERSAAMRTAAKGVQEKLALPLRKKIPALARV